MTFLLQERVLPDPKRPTPQKKMRAENKQLVA